MAKYMNLSQGQRTLVDDDTFEKVGHLKWYASFEGGGKWYAARRIWFGKDAQPKSRIQKLHRLIMGLDYGDKTNVDHINGDGFDNRKENLRACAHSDNQKNRTKQRDNKSGFKGVSWSKEKKMWAAQISYGGKHYAIGRFHDPAIAALCYDLVSAREHGEFVNNNGLLKPRSHV